MIAIVTTCSVSCFSSFRFSVPLNRLVGHDHRTAGLGRLEDLFNLDVLFLSLKTENHFAEFLLGKFQIIFTIMKSFIEAIAVLNF